MVMSMTLQTLSDTMSDRVCMQIDDASQSKHQTPEKQQLVSW
jgi:hypothetical protein